MCVRINEQDDLKLFRRFWMNNGQVKMLLKRIEIAVVVQEFVPVLDAKSCCETVERIADGDASLTQNPVIVGRSNRQFPARHFEKDQAIERATAHSEPGAPGVLTSETWESAIPGKPLFAQRKYRKLLIRNALRYETET